MSVPDYRWQRLARPPVEEKLGRCSRCVAISASFLVVAWAVLGVCIYLRIDVVGMIGAIVLTVSASSLAIAHSTAYVVRRRLPFLDVAPIDTVPAISPGTQTTATPEEIVTTKQRLRHARNRTRRARRSL